MLAAQVASDRMWLGRQTQMILLIQHKKTFFAMRACRSSSV